MRSRVPAHPAIVSVESFTEVQLLRRKKAAGGLEARRKLEHGPRRMVKVYALRSRVCCGYRQRRMEGTPRQDRIYYRCAARSIVPGSPILDIHPKNIYLPESAVLEPINPWIGTVGDSEHRDATVAQILGAAASQADSTQAVAAKHALAEAETRLRRLQAAIEAGADPAALVDSINRAQEQVTDARVACDQAPSVLLVTLPVRASAMLTLPLPAESSSAWARNSRCRSSRHAVGVYQHLDPGLTPPASSPAVSRVMRRTKRSGTRPELALSCEAPCTGVV